MSAEHFYPTGFAYNAIAQMTFVASAGIIFLCSFVSIKLISAFPPATSGNVSTEGSAS